jgi:hypothetical protein
MESLTPLIQVAENTAAPDRRFHDSYTLKPMRWDAAKKPLLAVFTQ